MKTILVLGCAVLNLLLPTSALGQAIFALANRHGAIGWGDVAAPISDAQGVPLAGTNFLAEVWGAATPAALAPLVTYNVHKRVFAPFRDKGYFFAIEDNVGVPTVPFGGWAWLQVRAWDARLGATYEEVVGRGLGGYGESPLFYARGGFPSPNGNFLAPLVGLQSFRLRPITPAVLMRSFRRQGDQVVIELNPGFKRYQLQQTSALDQPWKNVGEPTTATSITNSISGTTQFFRVIALLE